MRIIIFCFVFVFIQNSIAQIGLPFFTNYTPKDYQTELDNSPQNWSIVQDKRGVIYVANTSGVLEYDGVKWKAIKTTRTIGVQSLSVDNNGRIYVGGTDDFGYLEVLPSGELNYVSLLGKLKAEDKSFKEIFEIHSGPSEIYFRSEKKIFCLKKDKIKVFAAKDKFSRSFLVNDTFYVRQKISESDYPLYKIKKDSLIPSFDCAELGKAKIQFMLPIKEGHFLIGTKEKGMYLFNGEELTGFYTEADDFIKEKQLYRANILPDSTYAIGTLYGGVVIISKSGKLIKILDKTIGIKDETVINSYLDSQQGLWLGLNVGMARLEIPTALSGFNDNYGLQGIVMAVTRHQEKLYAATTQGVFKMENPGFSFQVLKEMQEQTWTLLSLKKTLLIGTNNGVYQMIGDKKDLISEGIAFSLCRSKKDSNRVFIGWYDGLSSIYLKDGRWLNEGKIKGFADPVKNIVESAEGKIWATADEKGIISLNSDAGINQQTSVNKYYEKKFGLPEGWARPYLINDTIIFATQKGFYFFDNSKNIFYQSQSFGKHFSNRKGGVSLIAIDEEKNIWISSDNKFGKLQNDGTFDYTASLRIPKTNIWCIYPDTEGIIWYGTDEGLIRFDSKVKKDYKIPFHALIRKVKAGRDSVIFKGAYYDNNKNTSLIQPESLKPSLVYKDNSISFEFAAPFFDNESENRYSYYLEGFDKGWSEWSLKPDKEYTYLPEGKYVFHIKAKNIYETISSESTYEFTVLSPWYRTIWAYGGYSLGFLFLISGTVRLNSRRLKANQLVLEGIINDRTAEVVQQKEEISKKNKDITDSINYAKKIQEAILPSRELIFKALKESFIIYKPKDIVSGDFYAFAEKNDKIIIASVDCTGHGVPGALMSMIGHDQLNQIINEKGITKPSKILTELNSGVKKILKQKNSNAETGDGMDISLCAIDLINNKMEYSGACRPLYLIRNSMLEEIKGDKMSIGGATDETYQFTNHSMKLKPGDSIYIFSDGYADQFGLSAEVRTKAEAIIANEKSSIEEINFAKASLLDGKKMMTKNLKNLLLSIQEKDMKTQAVILEETFELWKGSLEQVDDILLIGIRV